MWSGSVSFAALYPFNAGTNIKQVSGEIRLPPSISNNARGSGSSPLSQAKPFPSAENQKAAANLRNAAIAENPRLPKAAGEAAKPKPNAEIDSQRLEAKEISSQGYMDLFSPVKRKPKKSEKAVSLVGHKSAEIDKVTDPKLRASEKEDQRSVISAPQLWNESTKKNTRQENTRGDEHNQTNKPLCRSGNDAIIPSAEQKTPIKGIMLPPQERSVRNRNSDAAPFIDLHRISSVTSDVIKTSDKTNDGKLLSQIRSVRAKVEGDKAARGNLSLFAPYMSNKVKTSAVVRSGGMAEKLKVSSPPQEKNPDNFLQVLDRNRVGGRVDGSGDKTEGTPKVDEPPQEEVDEEEKLPSNEEVVESDLSFDGDIWLVEEEPVKGRKRKSPIYSDDLPSSSINSGLGERSSSRTASRAGSSKSRKTVSWDHGLDSHNNIDHSAFLTHETEPPSSPQFDISSERSWPSANTTGFRTSTPLADPTKKVGNASNRYLSGATSSSEEYSFHTTKEVTPDEAGETAELDPALRNALMGMQMVFMAEMKNMQTEMAKQFQVQRNVLEDLRSEMQTVREENEKLRNQVFELSSRKERHQ